MNEAEAEIERLTAEIQRQRQVIEAWREAYIKATGADQ
tara:strand:- start:73 stop:186 length:114 start_codon:yes stop_codon:yes gene_type:complete